MVRERLSVVGALCIVFLFLSGTVHDALATLEVDEQDLDRSRRYCFLSGLSEAESETLRGQGKGVLTLCFRPSADKDSASLVFEKFVEGHVRACMVHYALEKDCSGSGKQKVVIENQRDTVLEVCGGHKASVVSGQRTPVGPVAEKFARWVLPEEDITNGLKVAEGDQGRTSIPGIWSLNSVKYVTRVMGACGLRNLDFGWWSASPAHLKSLVRDYIQPQSSL